MTGSYLLTIAPFVVLIYGCSTTQAPNFTYTTSNDSARFYYQLGWQQIMDEGRYGEAEVSYRRALSFDPDFLLGKSVLARLTLDLDERLAFYQEVEDNKEQIGGSERKVLEVYQELVHFTNVREQQPEQAKDALDDALSLAENNLREVVHQYPDEVYLKSEYVEVLHSRHGAQAALDSLHDLVTAQQRNNPFLLGYAASMQAELGNFSEALDKAQQLEGVLNDVSLPKSHAVYADIYLAMDSVQQAKSYADRAVKLDSRNLDASRLQTRINQIIEGR